MLLQFKVELWCKHIEKLRVAGHEWQRRIRAAEHQRIPGCVADNRATEVPFEGFYVGARLHQLNSQRRDLRSGTLPRDGENPREAIFQENRRLSLDSQRP